jgi:hypothetical protein
MHQPLDNQPINPRIVNNFIDSCAFDPKYSPEDKASREIFQRSENDEINLNIAHSNQKEIAHPNTPEWVKREANKLIFSIKTGLTNSEIKLKAEILKILAGKGNPEKMTSDAEHVFEASKYGRYFITTDKRILEKNNELENICSVMILNPSEFLKILAMYENSNP